MTTRSRGRDLLLNRQALARKAQLQLATFAVARNESKDDELYTYLNPKVDEMDNITSYNAVE